MAGRFITWTGMLEKCKLATQANAGPNAISFLVNGDGKVFWITVHSEPSSLQKTPFALWQRLLSSSFTMLIVGHPQKHRDSGFSLSLSASTLRNTEQAELNEPRKTPKNRIRSLKTYMMPFHKHSHTSLRQANIM